MTAPGDGFATAVLADGLVTAVTGPEGGPWWVLDFNRPGPAGILSRGGLREVGLAAVAAALGPGAAAPVRAVASGPDEMRRLVAAIEEGLGEAAGRAAGAANVVGLGGSRRAGRP